MDKGVENYDVQQNIFGEFQGAWKWDEILFLKLDILYVHQLFIIMLSITVFNWVLHMALSTRKCIIICL